MNDHEDANNSESDEEMSTVLNVGRTTHGSSVYNEVGLLQKFEDIALPGIDLWVVNLIN